MLDFIGRCVQVSKPKKQQSELPTCPAMAKHIMLSGAFTSKETTDYMNAVKGRLEQLGEATFMVDAKPGQSFADQTLEGLEGARALVAFCTDDYG
eukprot:s1653_g3.t1